MNTVYLSILFGLSFKSRQEGNRTKDQGCQTDFLPAIRDGTDFYESGNEKQSMTKGIVL